MTTKFTDPQFQLGQLCSTPNALGKVSFTDIVEALGRHLRCDWGEVCKDDWKANDQALIEDTRLLRDWVLNKREPRLGEWELTTAKNKLDALVAGTDRRQTSKAHMLACEQRKR